MGDVASSNDALVPDLANVSKAVRRRRASKHDFKDGKGKVFAHRHDNGGGWVADTAYVAGTVKVTRNAQVFDFARVYDTCSIEGTSRVYGHAHLHHNVRVCGDARVTNHAVIRNSAQLGQRVTVCGSAVVSGNSNLAGAVVVADHALVHNTRIGGPRNNAETRIDGAAKLNDSRLTGYCRVGGAALVDRGQLTHVFVSNEARISLATIITIAPSELWYWLNSAAASMTPVNVQPDRVISYIEGTVVSSYYSGPRVNMRENTLMARCNIQINMYGTSLPAAEWPEFNMENMDMLIRVENATSLDEVRRRIHDGRNPLPIATPNIPQQIVRDAFGAPAIPVRGVAPDPSVPRQRRLLRLGE